MKGQCHTSSCTVCNGVNHEKDGYWKHILSKRVQSVADTQSCSQMTLLLLAGIYTSLDTQMGPAQKNKKFQSLQSQSGGWHY